MPKKLDCRLKINKSKKSCLKTKQKKSNKLKKSVKKPVKKSSKKSSKKSVKKSTKKVVKKVGKCFANKVVIKKNTKSDKKLMAIFTNNDKSRKKTVHFGANGMSDYTIHKDKDRMKRYLNRHKKRENWEQCDTAGALSRWVLWNKPSLEGSIKDYKKNLN